MFAYPDGAILHWGAIGKKRVSVMFVAKPVNHSFGMYKLIIESIVQGYDGLIFNKLWGFTKENSDYNIPIEYCSEYENEEYRFISKSIHFTNKKPWFYYKNMEEDILTKTYFEILDSLIDKYPYISQFIQ